MTSIQVKNLTKRFLNLVALHGLNLTVNPGELFFLLGPSGCGKTTLLRSLAGFYIPEGGEIWFGNENVTHREPHKRNTGMIFQSYALWPHMTVGENVSFGLEEQKVPKVDIARRVKDALASVQMEKYAERKPSQLSGGQQQRVALARALVVRPRCLLLDEPLSNLDAKLRLEMRKEIRRVCKEFKLTTIYVTHDQAEALSTADRIAILQSGHILQVGAPREVYKRPSCKKVADFIGESDFLSGKVIGIDGENATVETAVGRFTGLLGARDPVLLPALGADVTVSIRPECWKLHQELQTYNAIRGRIGDATYLGDIARYELITPSGAKLKSFECNPPLVDSKPRGELYATVAPEDVVVLVS